MPAAVLWPDDFLALLRGSPGGFNQFPEFRIFLERLVLARFQSGSEQKILERVPAHDSMDQHSKFVPLKIDTIIPHAKAVQDAPALLQFAELAQFRAEHLLGQTAKVAKDLQLQFLRHPPQLGGRRRREDDLKRVHNQSRVEGRGSRVFPLRR